jgi:uncharacterized membrane protein YhaH (DUF805 family)
MHLGWFLFATEGRISRGAFWIFNIFALLAAFLFIFFTYKYPIEFQQRLFLLYVGIFLWPSIAVQAKRWHDINRSAWWILIGIIPYVGQLYALFMNGFVEGTPGENRFGPDPLTPQEAEQ